MADIGNIRPNPPVSRTSKIVIKPAEKNKEQRSSNSRDQDSERDNDDDDKHIDEYA